MVSESLRGDMPLPSYPRTPLVGRDDAVARVRALLTESNVPLLTLTGPGGVGKTRLAQEIAASVGAAYADGVAFISLAPITDPALALAAIAQGTGVAETGERPLAEALATALRSRQLLLVLDNLEQVVAVAPVLADLLAACPALQILATSRGPLHIHVEREFPVPPLGLPSRPRRLDDKPAVTEIGGSDAVRLFLQRATAVSPTFRLTEANAGAIAEICQRVDGLPLAIELAASRIKILSPDALLALLSNRLKLLTGGPRDAPARQQTMRNAVAWSDDLLDEPAHLLLRRLGVFVGGCTLKAVTAVAGEDVYAVLDALTILVDQSLVRRVDRANGEPRFEMLEMIRDYAVEQLATGNDEGVVRQRHADWCLALAEESAALAGDGQARALTRLDAEHDNVRAALTWEIESGDPTRALRLAIALWRFWFIRGHAAEGLSWLQRALAAASAAPASQRAIAFNATGALSHARGDSDGAETAFASALALFREAGERRGAANALNNRGILAWYRGEYSRAAALHDEALGLFRELADQDGLATTLNTVGNVVHHQGDYSRAVTLQSESLAIYRSLRDRHGIAVSAISLGMALFERGDQAAAQTVYAESLALCQELGFQEGTAASLNNLGDLARAGGDLPGAAERYEESLVAYRELENQRGIAVCLRNLGLLARERGESGEAGSLATEALRLRAELRDRDGVAEGFEDLAALALAQPERAAKLFAAAAELRNTIGAPIRASERPAHDRALAAVRTRLTPAGWSTQTSAGRALSLDEALAEAFLVPGIAATRAVEAADRPAIGLSRREHEVLRLLVERRTDKEIGDLLSISPRTVMAHVASIFNKFGVTGRRDAAAYALRRGLV